MLAVEVLGERGFRVADVLGGPRLRFALPSQHGRWRPHVREAEGCAVPSAIARLPRASLSVSATDRHALIQCIEREVRELVCRPSLNSQGLSPTLPSVENK